MKSFGSLVLASISSLMLLDSNASSVKAESPVLVEKINAAVGCINRNSGRAYEARSRYLSWVGKNGPTGAEKIIYGTYTIYDTADCKKKVSVANALEPHDAELEKAATDYVTAVSALEPLLKAADDYYTQQDYKDDKMAKGKTLHPQLIAAWTTFGNADEKLRAGIDIIQDRSAAEKLVEIEKVDGRKGRYHIEVLMLRAKRLVRTQGAEAPDLPKIIEALSEYEATIKSAEGYAGANADSKIGSSFMGTAKSFLVTAKHLMRRIRDKVPYSQGEKMILGSAGASWMVEGSPARFTRDYNQLVESYNRGPKF
jgi:hypothetical protein